MEGDNKKLHAKLNDFWFTCLGDMMAEVSKYFLYIRDKSKRTTETTILAVSP